MKRGDVDFKYSNNVLYCNWYDNKICPTLS